MLEMLNKLIEYENVKKDRYGYWIHSKYPDFGERPSKNQIKNWEEENGVQIYYQYFEDSAPTNLVDNYYDNGDPDISNWNPKCYSKDSFLLAIFDTEDAPIAIFGIKTKTRLQKELMKKIKNF
jgi:hypothetical protein